MMRYCGFVLSELLFGILLLAILLLLAIPSWHALLSSNRALVYVDSLLGALNFARNTAVSQNRELIFCKSTNLQVCGGAWQAGQLLVDRRGKVVRSFVAVPQGDKLVWRGNLGKNDYLVFTPWGTTKGQAGSFYYYVKDKLRYRIVVSPVGTLRLVNVD